MDSALQKAWTELITGLGADPAAAATALKGLARRYDEEHRAYHGLAHIRHVLATVDMLLAEQPSVDDPAAVRLAAWFHDAVYDPRADDNEAASARLAQRELADLGIDEARIGRVAQLILATSDHRPRGDDAKVLVDADLAILAADPVTYDVYRRAIRVEYGHLDEATFRSGRTKVLEAFLAREQIYATRVMRARGEAVARRNLRTELDALSP